MKKPKFHHVKGEELGVFLIPADTDLPMEFKVVENSWQTPLKLIGGYVQEVPLAATPDLKCGCSTSLLVDEDGLLKGLPHNLRASILTPMTGEVVGDALLVANGAIDGEDGPEMTWVSLPREFAEWEGPGNPIPNQLKQPWDE